MGLNVIPTNDITKLDRQIKALRAIIRVDSPKDRVIHEKALRELEVHRDKLLKGELIHGKQ